MPIEATHGRPISLALRVTLLVGATLSVFLLVLGWGIQRSVEHHFAEQDAGELQVVAESIRHELSNVAQPAHELSLRQYLELAVAGHHGVYFLVTDSQGHPVYATPGANLMAALPRLSPVERIRPDALQEWQDDGAHYRGNVLHMMTGASAETFTVVVAVAMDFHLQYLKRQSRILWSIIICACAATLLAAWFAVQQGHAPLRQISRRIRTITSDKLDTRLQPESVPIELAELVESFNDMIGRMEDVFKRLSDFSADIAHELRTPITNLTTQTQVSLGKARSLDEYREILYSSLEEYERMAKMVDDMLLLAKTDNGLLKPLFVSVDIAAEIRALFDYFEAWAEERGVSLQLKGDAPPVFGDRAMLRRAFSNLLSNAIRYSPRDESVSVELSSEGSEVRISITNTGPDITKEHLPRLFDRFYRTDPSRQRGAEGSGLGLAIVKSIVDVHGGTVTATSDNCKTCFQVLLARA